MKPMLFFDIDGTLMNHHGFEVPTSTIQTLKKLKESGYLLGIATGRSYDSYLRTPIDSIINWDCVICNNGQIILDQNKKVLFEAFIEPSSVQQFLDQAKKMHYPVVVKCKNRFISEPADLRTKQVHAHFNNPIPPVGSYHGQKVQAMNIYAPKDYDYHDFSTIPNIHIIPCNLEYAEVSVEGVSKANSIKKALNYFHQDHYIAFGDSPNDQEMLKNASIAVAMYESNEELKDIATLITKPFDQDPIYYACLQLNLMKEGLKND